MSTYQYDGRVTRLSFAEATGDNLYVRIAKGDESEFLAVHLPAAERQAAAQALAGTDYVVVKNADWVPVEEHRPAPVDPATVHIGDLVEVSFHGLVVDVAGHVMTTRDRHGSDTYFSTKDATVRLVDRGGPDPAEVEALYQVLYETHNGGGTDEPPDERWSETYRHIARCLAARGVRVGESA